MIHFLLATVSLLFLCMPTQAQVFEEGFENYVPGSFLDGQGGWTGYLNQPDTTSLVVTSQVFSGEQSLRIRDGSDLIQGLALLDGKYHFQARVLVPAASNTSLWISLMNDYRPNGDNRDQQYGGTFWIEPNGVLYCFCGGFVQTSVVPGEWLHLEMTIDLDSDWTEGYVNGQLLGGWNWSRSSLGNQNFDVLRLDALKVYDPTTVDANGTRYVDDLRIDEVTHGQAYCASTVNSTGDHARIEALGTRVVSANDLELVASPVPDQFGLFFFSNQAHPTAPAFGDGFLCVGGGGAEIFRLPVAAAQAGSLRTQLDFGLPPAANILAGSTWFFQAWYRDPAAGGASFNTSNAREVTFL